MYIYIYLFIYIYIEPPNARHPHLLLSYRRVSALPRVKLLVGKVPQSAGCKLWRDKSAQKIGTSQLLDVIVRYRERDTKPSRISSMVFYSPTTGGVTSIIAPVHHPSCVRRWPHVHYGLLTCFFLANKYKK